MPSAQLALRGLKNVLRVDGSKIEEEKEKIQLRWTSISAPIPKESMSLFSW